jgi:hypothetical protein
MVNLLTLFKRWAGGTWPEVILEGHCEIDELLDVHCLGPHLPGEAKALEQGIDVGLRPTVSPEAVEHAPEVLAPVEENLADDRVEPGQITDDRTLLGIGCELHDG